MHIVMDNDLEKIEIRSEKVRNIIGEEPHWFIRYGTIVIAFLLVLLIIICLLAKNKLLYS